MATIFTCNRCEKPLPLNRLWALKAVWLGGNARGVCEIEGIHLCIDCMAEFREFAKVKS